MRRNPHPRPLTLTFAPTISQIIVWIPKLACLTRTTSSLKDYVASLNKGRKLDGVPQNTLLIMCFIHERSRGEESRFQHKLATTATTSSSSSSSSSSSGC